MSAFWTHFLRFCQGEAFWDQANFLDRGLYFYFHGDILKINRNFLISVTLFQDQYQSHFMIEAWFLIKLLFKRSKWFLKDKPKDRGNFSFFSQSLFHDISTFKFLRFFLLCSHFFAETLFTQPRKSLKKSTPLTTPTKVLSNSK